MDPAHPDPNLAARRLFLRDCAVGLGSIALGSLLADDGFALAQGEVNPLAPRAPHFAAKAKRVLYLHMAGSPSQLDLFDPKPKLTEYDGKLCPEELTRGERFAFIKGPPKLLGSPYRFAQHGQSGHMISELLPNLARVCDDIAIVRSMHTEQFNHAPGQIFMHTGLARLGRPSLGSWISYGLGTQNQDLPGFVVLLSGQYQPDAGSSLWSSGFLPSVHQGVRLRNQGDAVLYLSDPDGLDRASRRRQLDAIGKLNRAALEASGDPEVETRIAQYELAYRMQSSVPELLSIDSEPEDVRAAYAIQPGKKTFADNCLLARRLLERGVRFVQLYHWGWDSHGTGEHDDIVHSLPQRCLETDQPIAALLADLKSRGMLEDTLVIWSGEFGRTPMNEERNGSKYLGRDHHPHAFTIWLAGGGIRPGVAIGATDELGYHVTEDKLSVHDLHATALHLLGFDHTRLTHRSQGRDFRLTDVAGEVAKKLLA